MDCQVPDEDKQVEQEDAIDFAYYNIIQNNFAGQMPIFVDTMPNIRRTK